MARRFRSNRSRGALSWHGRRSKPSEPQYGLLDSTTHRIWPRSCRVHEESCSRRARHAERVGRGPNRMRWSSPHANGLSCCASTRTILLCSRCRINLGQVDLDALATLFNAAFEDSTPSAFAEDHLTTAAVPTSPVFVSTLEPKLTRRSVGRISWLGIVRDLYKGWADDLLSAFEIQRLGLSRAGISDTFAYSR